MKALIFLFSIMLITSAAAAEDGAITYSLEDVIAYGLKNNSRIRSARTDIDIETSGLRSAKADRMPRLDLSSGVTKYKYPAPLTPIYGSPTSGITFPEFDRTLYDAGVSFILPLYRGGRLDRGVAIAELRKSIAEDLFRMDRQELVYNLTSMYYKILQIEKLRQANDESVKQLEAHKKNVELFFKAGTVPKVELLKTDTELAHARQSALITKNALESAYELLKTLMGVEDMNRKIMLAGEAGVDERYPSLDESVNAAFLKRPDYQATTKKLKISEERVGLAQGRRFPALNMVGDFNEKSGTDDDFKENWTLGLRLSMPIFDGGTISADVSRSKMELLKAKEDERALRLEITREVRDAHLSIENAGDRINAASTAVESAKENLRIEQLKYKTGAGTSTDVIDAQTILLRAETDYYQALYDKYIALASLRRAIGEVFAEGEAGK